MSSLLQRLRHPVLPPAGALPPALDRAYGVALLVFGFLLPFSVGGISVMLAVLLLLAVAGAPALWRSKPWREPTWAIGLVLLAYIALHGLVVDGASASTRSMVVRYKELLMAPIVFAMVRLCGRRESFFHGLLAGAAVYALAHWVGLFSPRLAAALSPRYISAGFIFAVLAYQLVVRARDSGRPDRWLLAAAFFALTVLFALQGRTGQVVLLMLLLLAAWQQSPRKWRMWAVLAIPTLAVAAAGASPKVQQRLAETWEGFTHPQQMPSTSTEIRLELVRHGLVLAQQHFLVGGGYSHYSEMHHEAVRRAYGADPNRRALVDAYWARSENPHDEFLMQLVGGGLPALALFTAWLAAPLLRRRADGTASPELLGLVLAFAVGCLFNSLLMDFVEGHFYAALLAWLLAREAGREAA